MVVASSFKPFKGRQLSMDLELEKELVSWSEDLGKFQAKADIGIFVGYAPSRKGYKIYNKRTRRLMETIHVTFDEMHQTMAPNAGVANASSLGGHTLEAHVAGAYGSAAGNFVYDVTTHSLIVKPSLEKHQFQPHRRHAATVSSHSVSLTEDKKLKPSSSNEGCKSLKSTHRSEKGTDKCKRERNAAKDFYELWPEKFEYNTNGVTQIYERWEDVLSRGNYGSRLVFGAINEVKLVNAGKILENNKTLAESRSLVSEIPGGVITMHVVARPPMADKNSGYTFAGKAAKKEAEDEKSKMKEKVNKAKKGHEELLRKKEEERRREKAHWREREAAIRNHPRLAAPSMTHMGVTSSLYRFTKVLLVFCTNGYRDARGP
ncbi:retrovirus-related pol polyprotein from transposon TNT 1-94 [Tanacetum coccineum]